MPDVARAWPVAAEAARHAGTTLTLAPARSRYVLRAREAAGLPAAILAAAPFGGGHALHIGPDEWLLILPDGAAPPLVEGAHSLVEVSDRSVGFVIEGVHAAALIQTGCPLDIDRFQPGTATRTLFETVEIVLWRTGDAAFRVEVWRSFAPWLWAALDLAASDLT